MNVLIIGNGISAKSAYELALKTKDNPFLLIGKEEKIEEKYRYYLNEELPQIINKFDLFVISPGVYFDDERLIYIKQYNKKIIGEIEYAYLKMEHKPFIIAITGSNGKTSITEALYYVLSKLNYDVYKGGNIGIPFSSISLSLSNSSFLILELSNFQLDYIDKFTPNIAIITNITPNHLDKVENYESYVKSKLKIYKNMSVNNHLIYLENIDGIIDFKGNKYIIRNNINHLLVNKSIVEKVMDILNINNYEEYLDEFKGVKYRLEKINNHLYHDGKSTTPESTINAIKVINNNDNLIIIIGGKNKNLDFNELINIKVKKFIVYGEVSKILNGDNIINVNTLKEAFNKYKEIKDKNTILLYSPACTSFDQYENYIKRCQEFDQLIREEGYV